MLIVYHVNMHNQKGYVIRSTPGWGMWYKPMYSRCCSESHWLVPGTF